MSALDDGLAGQGGVILLAGEPGIGKTTLARELSEQAHQRGVPATWGVGLSAEAAPPYWHWIQIVRTIAGWPDGPQLLRSIPSQAAWLRMLVPDLEVDREEVDLTRVAEGRFHVYDPLLSLLRAAAQQSALVVVLDDLHAADEASLLALSFIAHSIADDPILIVGTHRDVELDVDARTVPELSELVRPLRSIVLKGLG